LKLAEKSLLSSERIYSLGPLIHNPHVVNSLTEKGIEVIHDLRSVPGEQVLIRSHGAAPQVFQQAEEMNVRIIDATCPFVKRVQRQAAELVKNGYQVLILGQEDHPEVQGILGWAGGGAEVIESISDLDELAVDKKRVGILAQTTQNRSKYFDIVSEILGKSQELRVFDTICHTSQARQEEAAEISQQVDVMFVIGGKNSANTCQLVDICKKNVTTYHIEEADALTPEMLYGASVVGVTAGASTPDWIIEEVIERMMMYDEELEKVKDGEVEAVNDSTPSEAVAEPETVAEPEAAAEPEVVAEPEAVTEDVSESDQEEMMNLDLGSPRQIKQGDVISGIVVQVQEDEVLIDIGGKSEGVIPRRELSQKDAENVMENIKVGDELDVYVLRVDNDEGHLILSKKRADKSKALDFLERAMEEKTELAGKVVRVVKGGLLVDVEGVSGFVPASLIERGYAGDLEKYLDKTLRLRVIEFDRNKAKVVLSQKAILQDEFMRSQKELWDTIEAGEIRKGTVRHLTNFGAFVDLGGVDGLLHISELSWGRVKHPSEVVQEGDETEVYVISVDKEKKRISLSLKQVQGNPWDKVDENYEVGEIITGTVMRTVSFGAFVQLEPGVEGLVHISRMADYHVAKPEDIVNAGDEIQVKILDINKQDQRISLSIKDAQEDSNTDKEKKDEESDKSQNSSSSVGVNLGEVFGDLLTKAER
jgi:ribosomal protein S1/(E)-4-hydroxy-3-methyl-but-2-enyl pyrophosphate reductase